MTQRTSAQEQQRREARERVEAISQLPIYRGRSAALLTDFYELTMMYGYHTSDQLNQRVVFDMYYRINPCGNGYVIAAGLEQVVWYLHNLAFTDEDIEYLRSLAQFSDDFLTELRQFRFTGDLYAVPEGTVVFPNEPMLRFEGRVFELQLIESAVLSFVNHQSLIATKARRIVDAARTGSSHPNAPVIEMGLRRAQNMDASVFGARAAVIGGCVGTSNVLAGQSFGIPVLGTQAHSWVQNFDCEIDAFRAYADAFPDNVVLLVDTYDVLHSGVPNTIALARELAEKGRKVNAIRIDSGDLAYLSKRARHMLDQAGFSEIGVIASGDLDEFTIRDLLIQGAQITAFGVGTHLITSQDCPALGGVYKLAARQRGNTMEACIKVSENAGKVTNPGKKKVLRFLIDGSASADLVALDDEVIDPAQPLELFDPVHTYKRKTIHNFTVEPLLVPVYEGGELVYTLPDLSAIQNRVEEQLGAFSSEVLRPVNPHVYHVDLSHRLWDLKHDLLLAQRPAGAPPV